MTYCVLTSPLLLIALAVSGIGIYLKSSSFFNSSIKVATRFQSMKVKICRSPERMSPANTGNRICQDLSCNEIIRYALVGVVSAPLLFIAGAGAALFWTLGATGIHKTRRAFVETHFKLRLSVDMLPSVKLQRRPTHLLKKFEKFDVQKIHLTSRDMSNKPLRFISESTVSYISRRYILYNKHSLV